MKHLKFSLAITAIVLVSPSCVLPQSQPDPLYFVENNTARPLRCNVSFERGTWDGWFTLNPGEEFSDWGTGGTARAHWFCTSQKETRPYRIRPGKRYSLLQDNAGAVRLRRIDPDAQDRR